MSDLLHVRYSLHTFHGKTSVNLNAFGGPKRSSGVSFSGGPVCPAQAKKAWLSPELKEAAKQSKDAEKAQAKESRPRKTPRPPKDWAKIPLEP